MALEYSTFMFTLRKILNINYAISYLHLYFLVFIMIYIFIKNTS